MAISQQLTTANTPTSAALLEKVIMTNDLAGLSSLEKVSYVKNVCESLGLNPLTRPFQLLKFDGKETLYATKDATEQLRKNNRVSIVKIESNVTNGVYIVTAHAVTPDGRSDASTGVIQVDGLKGAALCNAMMKAETKAKRRATLSICGLGFIDESELDTMEGAKKIDVYEDQATPVQNIEHNPKPLLDLEFVISNINDATNMEFLETAFKRAYKMFAKDKSALLQLVSAKDRRKEELQQEALIEEVLKVEDEL